MAPNTVLILCAGVPRAAGQNRSRRRRPPLDVDFFEIARVGTHDTYDGVVRLHRDHEPYRG